MMKSWNLKMISVLMVVPLLGRFNGECHVPIMGNENKSGIMTRKWVERVVNLLSREGLYSVG